MKEETNEEFTLKSSRLGAYVKYYINLEPHFQNSEEFKRNVNLIWAVNKEMKQQTFTREEVIELLLAERTRARDIAYEFKDDHDKSYITKKNAGNEFAFIEDKIANECRFIGNAISGLNALSVALKETMRDRIEKDLK